MGRNDKIISIARSWLGTPWMHCQKTKGVGVDCINFLGEVAKEAGYDLPAIPKSYARLASGNQIEQFLDDLFIRTNLENLIGGNILLFKFAGYNNHVAIATSKNSIIHASIKDKRVIEHTYDGVWKRCTVGLWELTR